MISPDKVKLGQYRVRVSFDEEKMETLKASIKRKKVMTPIVVRHPDEEGYYELIAGERRLRAAKELGLKEIPAIVREASLDDAIIEMGIENILREDLSFYERGRWVEKLVSLGWPVTSISEETGIPKPTLSDWWTYYKESERISSVTEQPPITELPLEGMLQVKRAPIPEEKKAELAVEATRMERPPRVTEIERATRFIEQEPELTAREALERARGINILVSIPEDLMGRLRAQAREWGLTLQDTIIEILRDYLE
jgi:ParB family chromosome partitioning protein